MGAAAGLAWQLSWIWPFTPFARSEVRLAPDAEDGVTLGRYVEDARYSIDNNVQENAIRPFCVGRRNWLFADTVGGANASSNLYSLLQTCRVNGIDGYRYLRALFIALPRAKTADDYAALLPWRINLAAA